MDFRDYDVEGPLGLTKQDRQREEEDTNNADLWIGQYAASKTGKSSVSGCGMGITTTRARFWQILQRSTWALMAYKFPESTRDARLADIRKKCEDNEGFCGNWVPEKRGLLEFGTTQHLIDELEKGARSYRAMEPFDNMNAEELVGLGKQFRAESDEGQLEGQLESHAWIVQYLPPKSHRSPDDAKIYEPGLGITTEQEVAEKAYTRSNWQTQMYKFSPSTRYNKMDAIVNHCYQQPMNFGSWIPQKSGVHPRYGTSSFLIEAGKRADAAAEARDRTFATQGHTSVTRSFDPIRDI